MILVGLMILALIVRRTKIAVIVASGFVASELVAYTGLDVVSMLIICTSINIIIALGCIKYWRDEGDNIGAWMTLMTSIAAALSFSKLAAIGVVSGPALHNSIMNTVNELLIGVAMFTIALLLLLPSKPWTLHELLADIKHGISRLGYLFGHSSGNGRET